jgi:hypothetical protein
VYNNFDWIALSSSGCLESFYGIFHFKVVCYQSFYVGFFIFYHFNGGRVARIELMKLLMEKCVYITIAYAKYLSCHSWRIPFTIWYFIISKKLKSTDDYN